MKHLTGDSPTGTGKRKEWRKWIYLSLKRTVVMERIYIFGGCTEMQGGEEKWIHRWDYQVMRVGMELMVKKMPLPS